MRITEQQKRALIKRSSDFLEKMSIASFAVGIFQSQMIGILLGTLCITVCGFLTYFLERE